MLLTAPMFGSKHLIGLVLVAILYTALYFLAKKKEVPSKNVIFMFTIALLSLEFIKLLYLIIRDGSFPMNHIPLHLCSLPLYVYSILAFTKNETLKELVKPAAFAGVLFGGTIALLYPVNIIGGEVAWRFTGDNFLPFISFLYHGIMIFLPIYLIKSGTYEFEFRRLKDAYIVLVAFMALAMIVNAITGKDFMLLNTGNGSPLAFLLDNSQIVYTGSMIVLGLVGVLLFHLLGFAIKKKD